MAAHTAFSMPTSYDHILSYFGSAGTYHCQVLIFFFSWPYPSHVFRFLGPRHNRGMGFQNNWYYALLIDWWLGHQCIFFFITLTSSVSSGHVLRKGRPGSTVPAGVSPCSCEYKCASRVSSQFIFTPRNCMSRSQLILVLSISK